MATFSSNIDITNGGTYAMNITNGEKYSKIMTDLNNKMSRIQSYLQNNLPETYTSLPTSLPHGKLIIYNNQLYFGNSSSVPVAVFLSSGGTITGNLTVNGETHLNNAKIRLGKNNAVNDSNPGTVINIGDGDYIHFSEPTDDNLEIKAKNVNFVVSGKVTKNGTEIGSGSVSTSNITGTLPIDKGGTGATSASSALSNLGAAASNHTHSDYAPKNDPVFTGEISRGRKSGTTIGWWSVALGENVEASNGNAFAEGSETVASGIDSHAEGCKTTVESQMGHAEGYYTHVTGYAAHAEGEAGLAEGKNSHAEGFNTFAMGDWSHAEGRWSQADVECAHAEGCQAIAYNFALHACGKFNKEGSHSSTMSSTTGDVFVIGNGTSSSLSDASNCFRITYKGAVYGLSAFNSSGADYAEYFEWEDGNANNEDRVGYFVTMKGNKIRIANSDDYILGIVSGQPCIIGNADEDWLGRWQRDEYGRFVLEYLEDEKTEISTEGLSEEEINALYREPDIWKKDGKLYRTTTKVVDYETPSYRFKANPDYDSSQPYIERKDRKEWSAIGMMGVLSVRDDGTCKVNGYCKVADGGIATESPTRVIGETWRVIERVTPNVVKIVYCVM